MPKPNLEQAVVIQTYLLKNYAAETSKRTLKQLSACCEWAMRKKLITDNPFKELAKEIRTKKKSRVSRKPFSRTAAQVAEKLLQCSFEQLTFPYFSTITSFMMRSCRKLDQTYRQILPEVANAVGSAIPRLVQKNQLDGGSSRILLSALKRSRVLQKLRGSF